MLKNYGTGVSYQGHVMTLQYGFLIKVINNYEGTNALADKGSNVVKKCQ
jgi:hypothetical protein